VSRTVLSSIGIEPPEIDVWAYGRSVGRVEVVEAVQSQGRAKPRRRRRHLSNGPFTAPRGI
jgi:hypothetical protein